MNLFKISLEMLFPRYCLLCLSHTDTQYALCQFCESTLPWLKQGCQHCGLPPRHSTSTICGRCVSQTIHIDKCLCCFHYTQPVDHWISLYKFNRQLHFKPLFEHWLYQLTLSLKAPIDHIIAMPIHIRRLKTRGFNQCDLLAKNLCRRYNLTPQPSLLIRNRDTAPQMTLPAKQRKKNTLNCFTVTQKIEGQHIVIVEDIITTGATINEAAKTLKSRGAKTVSIIAIARATNQTRSKP